MVSAGPPLTVAVSGVYGGPEIGAVMLPVAVVLKNRLRQVDVAASNDVEVLEVRLFASGTITDYGTPGVSDVRLFAARKAARVTIVLPASLAQADALEVWARLRDSFDEAVPAVGERVRSRGLSFDSDAVRAAFAARVFADPLLAGAVGNASPSHPVD